MTPSGWKIWLVLAARLAVGLMLAYAAVPKLLDPATFAQSIDNYRMLPAALIGVAALALPILEVVIALSLVSGLEAKGGALIATALFVVFTVGMAQAIMRGIDLSCGCFGAEQSARVGWGSIARNLVLLALCAVALLGPDASWRSLLRASSETTGSGTA